MQAAEQLSPGFFKQQEARPLRELGGRHALGARPDVIVTDITSGSLVGGVVPALTQRLAVDMGAGKSHVIAEFVAERVKQEDYAVRALSALRFVERRLEEAQQALQRQAGRPRLVDLYETQLSDRRERVRDLETERTASAAETNRALMGGMVDHDWLGSRLLAQLAVPMTVSALAVATGVSVDAVAVSLARLHRGGAVDTEGERFVRSERGAEMLGRLEQATGVDLIAG